MAHTHEYDCIVCGAHLDTQDQLARHNKEEHLRTATGMERPRRSAKSGEPGRGRSDKRQDPPRGEL